MIGYVCVLSTDNYLDGVLILNENLKKLNSKYDLLCVINEEISDYTKGALEFFNIKYKIINSVNYNNYNDEKKYWKYTFDKLNIFSLVEYEKFVFLDLDLLIIENIDHLFEYDKLSMALDYPFSNEQHNSGVMVVIPNLDDYNNLIELAIKADQEGRNISDQVIINEYFRNINTLPQEYNEMREVLNKQINLYDYIKDTLEEKYCTMLFYVNDKKSKIIHYIGKMKPFMLNRLFSDEYTYLYNGYLNDIRIAKKQYETINSDKMISIIVPIYNKENYLERCIDSIINQTYKNLEIILVDDCSTDSSNEICQKYKELDKRIKYIKNEENKGVSYSRNIGLEAANGEMIGFVDADDYIDNNMYELLALNMDLYNSDLAQCGVILNENNKKFIQSKQYFANDNYELVSKVLNEDLIDVTVWNKLYKRELIADVRFEENINKHEDTMFILNMVKRLGSVIVINDCLYHYVYQKDGSLSNDYSFDKNIKLLEYIQSYEEYILNQHPTLIKDVYNFELRVCRYIFNEFVSGEFSHDDAKIVNKVISNAKNKISSSNFDIDNGLLYDLEQCICYLENLE